MARLGPGDRLAGGAAGASAKFATPKISQLQADFLWLSPQKFRAVYGFSKKTYEKARDAANKRK